MTKKDKIKLKRDNDVCELVELVCPSCGASLQMVDKTHAKCSFCGKEVVIDEATGTDVLIEVDSQGLEKTSNTVALIINLIKGFAILFIICVLIAAAIYFFANATDYVTDKVEEVVTAGNAMDECGIKEGLERIFHKDYALITSDELASIKYINEDFDAGNSQFIITYSMEDYTDYDDFEDYTRSFQSCYVDSRNVAWSKNYSMLTGLEGFQDSMSLINEVEFAPKVQFQFYIGNGDLQAIEEKADVSGIRELVLNETKEQLKGISKFLSLERLQVNGYYGNLRDIDELGECQKLKSLVLYAGEDLTDFSTLYKLNHLNELSLTCSGLKSIDFIKDMTELSKLEILSGVEIDFHPIADVITLSELSLYTLEDYSLLQNLTNLQSLHIKMHDTYFDENPQDFAEIAKLPRLQKLILSGDELIQPNISNNDNHLETLFNMDNLRTLSITNVECTLELNQIKVNENITYLDMSGTTIQLKRNGEILESPDTKGFEIVTNMPGLETLILRDCDIRNISFLKNLQHMKVCNLETNFINDFSALAENTSLETLYCGDNTTSIVDLPEHVQVYKKLESN